MMAVEERPNGPTPRQQGSEGPVALVLPVRGMTCQSCVRHVRAALLALPGVAEVQVDLIAGQARMKLDPRQATVEMVREAVEEAGYVGLDPVSEAERKPESVASAPGNGHLLRRPPFRPVLFGVLGSAALAGLYLGLVTLAQGLDHATELLLQDWYLVLPITLGFGIQVGLFFYLRTVLRMRKGTTSATALAGAGTGTSSVAMVACCAHHLADLLPFIGLSGAALLLADYRQPLMLAGIAVNLVGIAVMARTVRRVQRRG